MFDVKCRNCGALHDFEERPQLGTKCPNCGSRNVVRPVNATRWSTEGVHVGTTKTQVPVLKKVVNTPKE